MTSQTLNLDILNVIQQKFEDMKIKMNENEEDIINKEDELTQLTNEIKILKEQQCKMISDLELLQKQKEGLTELHEQLVTNYEQIRQSAETLLSVVSLHENI